MDFTSECVRTMQQRDFNAEIMDVAVHSPLTVARGTANSCVDFQWEGSPRKRCGFGGASLCVHVLHFAFERCSNVSCLVTLVTCWSHVHSLHCSLESRLSGWRDISRYFWRLDRFGSSIPCVAVVTICFTWFIHVWILFVNGVCFRYHFTSVAERCRCIGMCQVEAGFLRRALYLFWDAAATT